MIKLSIKAETNAGLRAILKDLLATAEAQDVSAATQPIEAPAEVAGSVEAEPVKAKEPVAKLDRAAVKFRFAELVNSDYDKAEKLLDNYNADRFDDLKDNEVELLAKALG